MSIERSLYQSTLAYWANQLLFPLKMVVPQPAVARMPGLTTNEEIRTGVVLNEVVGRVLDIGCGGNRLVQTYRQRGGQGVGLDVHPWEGVDCLVADSSRLPQEDGSFDTVTIVAALNHMPNREMVLGEAYRVLSSNGRLVVTNLRPLVSRVWHRWAFWDRDQHVRGMQAGEVWGFARQELETMLHRHRFRVVKYRRFSWGLNELYVCQRL
jgi:ubiquinone/menaquinone biosynthesis C-methylase UbiE